MNFKQRLIRYLVGFGIGLVLVYVFFKDRNVTGWLPENRVKEQINSSQLNFSDGAACYIECLDLPADWLKTFLTTAEVNFKKSDTRKEPCPEYYITGELGNEEAEVIVESCEKKSVVQSIILSDTGCNCPN